MDDRKSECVEGRQDWDAGEAKMKLAILSSVKKLIVEVLLGCRTALGMIDTAEVYVEW
jgi:hypothetical protein